MKPVTRIDLHLHSKFSKQTSHWLLNRIGCPESFSEPRQIYERAKKKGMTRVTITDHNAIEGCLEIMDLPDTFISEEVTTFLPDDPCPIHLLVYHINEAQHREIQALRQNVLDLVKYLRGQGIIHVQAHPFYAVNNRLTIEHFERTLLLFKNFELNGGRDGELNHRLKDLLLNLTPKDIEKLSDKYKLSPMVPEPWRKNLVGGSDDHSLFHIASQYTEMEGVDSLEDFLQGIEAGRARVMGRSSTPHLLAHSIYSVAYQFYKNKFGLGRAAYGNIFFRFLDRSLHPQGDWPKGFLSRLYALLNIPQRLRLKNFLLSTLQDRLRVETLKIINYDPELTRMIRGDSGESDHVDRRWFQFVSGLSNKLTVHYGKHFLHHASRGYILQSFQSMGSITAMYLFLTPYLIAFSNFARDRRAAIPILKRFLPSQAGEARQGRGERIAHFTDTWKEGGESIDFHLETSFDRLPAAVITCQGSSSPSRDGIYNFLPVGTLSLPGSPEHKLHFPPFLEILQFCYEKNFRGIHSATAGPLGLTALGVARILRLPIWGTYQAGFPQFIRALTADAGIESFAWRFTRWYYNQMQMVFVPSPSAAQELIHRGVASAKIRILPPAVDLRRFHPSKKNGYLEERFGINGGLKLLYVGPISKGKNIHLLVEAFHRLSASIENISLILVGDGPDLEEIRQRTMGTPCYVTGPLPEEDLPYVFASCDLFVLPSTDELFAHRVLEAQASGLPVIVTDAGGPKENILPEKTGLVIPGNDSRSLFAAIEGLLLDHGRRNQMRQAARRFMEERYAMNAPPAIRATSAEEPAGPFIGAFQTA